MLQRSCLVPLLLALVVAFPAAAQDGGPPVTVEVSHLAGPLYLLRCNNNTQMVASVGADGTLLVDTGYAGTAAAAQQALAGLGAGPIRIIVNTHGDADHVGGNAALGGAATIVAHPAARRQIGNYFALPAATEEGLPAVTVESAITVYFNDDEIRLLPLGGGHTAGDLVVHFTGSRVACVGDIVLSGTFPNADPARGGDAQRLAAVIHELTELLPADTTLVPGHGPVLTMPELATYLEMVEGTTAAVAREFAAGRDLNEILARRPLASWAEWARPERRLGIEDWSAEIYESLTGEVHRSICEPMTEALVRDGAEAAVAIYTARAADEPDSWSFAENELNRLGYELLQRGMVDEAITIFELNVTAYPNAFNTHDSLGEAYMVAGDSDRAVASYRRSLELNPDNTNAIAMLARLRGE
jgi:glyoxylase-like metal-dependent hydrolase (beta-lactamase superfamily II)